MRGGVLREALMIYDLSLGPTVHISTVDDRYQVAKLMGGRTYKQCRERYTNYLKEGLNVGPWSKEEDQLLLTMHGKVGNKWAEIARHLKGICRISNMYCFVSKVYFSHFFW